ncbi:MAG: cyanophycin synthetase [Pseudomonadota bacterium]
MNPIQDIQLLRVNYLRGPNIWTYRPVLEVWLDLGELENYPSHLLPGFPDRLVAFLPGLVEHHCGVGEHGGFVQRLYEGTWSGHVLEHVVIELLNLAGMPTGFGQTRSTSRQGVYRMVFRARDEQVARTALACGHSLLMAAIRGEAFEVAPAVAQVKSQIDACFLGPSTACIVAAATDRSIPHLRLNDGNLVQLGYGAAQRRIWTAETERTSAIAEGIARDKDLTKSLLKSCGVPVPEGARVESAEAAWEAALDIGLPVVVKPSDGNHGRGVSLDLKLRHDVEAAFNLAREHGSEVLVERFIKGHEHRMLVVGGKVVAAARGEAAWVTGDGKSTVVQLVDAQLNTDPRRGLNEDAPLNLVETREDEAILLDLQRQGLGPDAVPEAGRQVLIQRNGNVAIDCTDQVHPEVDYAVSLAARAVGLDIAGIDLVALDISQPLQAQGGAIVEVNAGPGLLMHLKPAEGVPRPVGRAIVDHLFPEGESGRIPVVGVAGSRSTQTIARLVGWLLHLSGAHVGLACRDGLFLEGRCVAVADHANWASGHRLLMNQAVEAVVLENSAACILRDGLAYDRCQIGIVTDMDGFEGLAEFDITAPEQLHKVLRTQVDVVLSGGLAVLNAEEPAVVELGPLCDGGVLLYAHDPAPLAAHRETGGKAVFVRDHSLVMATGTAETQFVALAGPGLQGALGRERLPSVLAAASAAWALGVAPDLISAGLETFQWAPPAAAPLRGTQVSA